MPTAPSPIKPAHWARQAHTLPVLIALLLFVAGIILSVQLHRLEQEAAIGRAEALRTELEGHFEEQQALLDAVHALFQLTGPTDRSRFDAFVREVARDQRASGMLGVGYAAFHPIGQDAAVRAALQQGYGALPQQTRTEQGRRATIILLWPATEQNRRAIGYDMYAQATRRAAMERAMRRRAPSVSGRVRLVQGGAAENTPGFLLYTPYFREAGNPLPTGFIYAPYRAEEFLSAAIGRYIGGDEGVTLWMHSSPRGEAAARTGDTRGPSIILPLNIADQRWTMHYHSQRLSWYRNWSAVALGGSLASALFLGLIVFLSMRRAEFLHRLADERAGRAQDKDLLLAEMSHRLKNSYARITALINITAREERTIEDFARTLAGRIQALSASVSIFSGGVESAHLHGIVEAELQRSAPGEQPRYQVSGADPLLTEHETQALSLTVHELATNSVKYGALGKGGTLRVSCRRDGDTMHVDWVESDYAVSNPSAGEGFGSRFIQSVVTRQLGGTLDRTVHADGATVHISWPCAHC